MKMSKLSLFDDMHRVDETTVLQRINELRPLYETGGLWKGFKDWVAKHKPASDALSLSKLKAKTLVEITSCEPHVVSQAFTALEEMLERAHITHNGRLIPSECSRVAVCDEKGFSTRQGYVQKTLV